MIRCLRRLSFPRRRRAHRKRLRLALLLRELGGRPHRNPLLQATLPKPHADERRWQDSY